MQLDDLKLLRLMQLADSALPIGSTAHSFGLEALVVEEGLGVEQLESFLRDYVQEVGTLEAVFCRSAYRLASLTDVDAFAERWLTLNARLSAFKTARESRSASATLGRRFLQLVYSLEESPLLHTALRRAKAEGVELHYCIAFGLVGGILAIDETAAVLAYLQQALMGLVFACQRLMPLGQSSASTLLWRIKPALLATAEQSALATQHEQEVPFFTPLLDLESMRHPNLGTRLFIS